MNILVACEESQRVCMAFREKGHRAFSCDVIECSGGHPEWHIMQDVIPLLNGNCEFKTCDGKAHTVNGKWDMIIAHLKEMINMCLGKTQGIRVKDGDRYELDYLGQKFPYVAKDTPNGIVLVHDSDTPLGYPLGAIPLSDIGDYKFERVEE